jgi:hypothetical protein
MKIEVNTRSGIIFHWERIGDREHWGGNSDLIRAAKLLVQTEYSSPSVPWPELAAAEHLARDLGATVTHEGRPEFDPGVIY